MSGSITVGGKILASHDNVSGKLSMSGDVDLANVDMSNMVFPAGHVVQVKIIPSNAYVANSTTSWNTIDTIFINNVSSSNKIVIEAAISHLIEGSGQGAYRIIRASDSVELCHSQHGTGGNGSWRMMISHNCWKCVSKIHWLYLS